MRFKTLTEMREVIPDGVEEFEVSLEEYNQYLSLLLVRYRGASATFRGTKLIVTNVR